MVSQIEYREMWYKFEAKMSHVFTLHDALCLIKWAVLLCFQARSQPRQTGMVKSTDDLGAPPYLYGPGFVSNNFQNSVRGVQAKCGCFRRKALHPLIHSFPSPPPINNSCVGNKIATKLPSALFYMTSKSLSWWICRGGENIQLFCTKVNFNYFLTWISYNILNA